MSTGYLYVSNHGHGRVFFFIDCSPPPLPRDTRALAVRGSSFLLLLLFFTPISIVSLLFNRGLTFLSGIDVGEYDVALCGVARGDGRVARPWGMDKNKAG